MSLEHYGGPIINSPMLIDLLVHAPKKPREKTSRTPCTHSVSSPDPIRYILTRYRRSYLRHCPRNTNETRRHRPKAVSLFRESTETRGVRWCLSRYARSVREQQTGEH